MSAATNQRQMQDALAVIEQLRITARIDMKKLAAQAGVPLIQYLKAMQGQKKLSDPQLAALTKALTTFSGGRA